MVVPIVFTLTTTGLATGLNRRQVNATKGAAYQDGVRHWHVKYRLLHFLARATKRYGYRARSGAGLFVLERAGRKTGFKRTYSGRKLKKFGHMRPLVFTGGAERQSRQNAKFKRTSTGAVVTMRVPGLNWRPEGWNFTLRSELEIVRDDEAVDMKKVVVVSLVKNLKRWQKKLKKKRTTG